MGLMRFVSPSGDLCEKVVEQAYLAGYDRIPWRARVRIVEQELLVERENSDSGNLYIPWKVNGHGQVHEKIRDFKIPRRAGTPRKPGL